MVWCDAVRGSAAEAWPGRAHLVTVQDAVRCGVVWCGAMWYGVKWCKVLQPHHAAPPCSLPMQPAHAAPPRSPTTQLLFLRCGSWLPKLRCKKNNDSINLFGRTPSSWTIDVFLQLNSSANFKNIFANHLGRSVCQRVRSKTKIDGAVTLLVAPPQSVLQLYIKMATVFRELTPAKCNCWQMRRLVL